MVTLLYALILVPLIIFLAVFAYETFLSIQHIFKARTSKAQLFTQATGEITHTVFVYSFTVFMVSHAAMLPAIAATVFLPVALYMTALLIRGCLYLYLFYSENPNGAPRRFWHSLFALTYFINLATVAWLVIFVSDYIGRNQFIPSTDNLPVIAAGAAITLLVCALPIFNVYRHSTTEEE